MAKEGKKLELYEILAAKRARGKAPLSKETKPIVSNVSEATPDPVRHYNRKVIVDPAVEDAYAAQERMAAPPPTSEPEPEVQVSGYAQAAVQAPSPSPSMVVPPPPPVLMPPTVQPAHDSYPEPAPEPRVRSSREVVFGIDSAFILFVIIIGLLASSYFLGYKRGQEEKPAGVSATGDVESGDFDKFNVRALTPAARPSIRPPEQDYTLVLRSEAAKDALPERLEMELSEALAKAREKFGEESPGFIFKTGGSEPRFVLAVGVGKDAVDPGLDKLLKFYNTLQEVVMSREPWPYKNCKVAPIRELGTPVY